jgi:hypothetical protein
LRVVICALEYGSRQSAPAIGSSLTRHGEIAPRRNDRATRVSQLSRAAPAM